MQTVLWILSILLIAAGLAGTVLPALPGIALVFVGIALGAWIDDFTRVSVFTVVICGLLTLAGWAIDYLAALMGAKRAGASGLALLGAALGTVLGLFGGLVGLLLLPLAGAALGQFITERNAQRAATVGLATWIGLMVGTVAKVVIACFMVGMFVLALVF